MIGVAVLTEQPEDVDQWISDIASLQSAQQALIVNNVYAAHLANWESVWGRSYINIQAPNGSNWTQVSIQSYQCAQHM